MNLQIHLSLRLPDANLTDFVREQDLYHRRRIRILADAQGETTVWPSTTERPRNDHVPRNHNCTWTPNVFHDERVFTSVKM